MLKMESLTDARNFGMAHRINTAIHKGAASLPADYNIKYIPQRFFIDSKGTVISSTFMWQDVHALMRHLAEQRSSNR